MLGFDDAMPQPGRVAPAWVHGQKLAVFRGESGELRVARDACPHRAASLSTGTVCGEALVCPYHARQIGVMGFPERFFDYVVRDGLVWLDFASDLCAQHHPPPRWAEHGDPAMRTFGYTKTLRVNPVLMTENTMDWNHLATVHRVHFVSGVPRVTIHSTGPRGKAEYAYDSDLFELRIENEYHVPFSTSLRFLFRDKKTGRDMPPLLLWFSLTPTRDDQVALHLRVSRGVLTSPLADWVFRLVDELPLVEDAHVVGGVDPSEWGANRLDVTDEFVAAYRQAMSDAYPEVLDWYVPHVGPHV